MNRYAAKLLFQFRVVVDGDSGKRRWCEERIVVFRAASARKALAMAKTKGKAAQFDYTNADGNNVYFEFIGVQELMHLGVESDKDTVWWDIGRRLMPMERRERFLLPEDELDAITYEKAIKQPRESGGQSARPSGS
jgi:hypothetical protein